MTHRIDSTYHTLLNELSELIPQLGLGDGLMSASVYETAQLLRYYPFEETMGTVIQWLLSQQEDDGGWGKPSTPLYRAVPTLAAVLALHCRGGEAALPAVHAGLRFLDSLLPLWRPPLPDQIPVGFELTLPSLLDDAQTAGLVRVRTPYAAVDEMGYRRRSLIARMRPVANTPPVFSWETWGGEPRTDLLDELGSVGHSPAATAKWLASVAGHPGLGTERQCAEAYLRAASGATGLNVAGIVPGPWPVKRFEQAFGLYPLLLADLLQLDTLQHVLAPQLEDLRRAMRPGGIGFSDVFAPDGDDTAAAVALLTRAGLDVSFESLFTYARNGHFATYPFEMHASLTVTARAVHALAISGANPEPWTASILEAQKPDGWWYGDKWNISQFYSTSIALLALRGDGYTHAKRAALDALCATQHVDGGWGICSQSTPIDTSFALLALHSLQVDGYFNEACERVYKRAHGYLLHAAAVPETQPAMRWISKDLFCPERIDRLFVLCALMAPLTCRYQRVTNNRHSNA
jgi:hypothetical protein